MLLVALSFLICEAANAEGEKICTKPVKELATHELINHALVAQSPKEMFGDKGRLYYVALLGTHKTLRALLSKAKGVEIGNDVMISAAAAGDLEVMKMLLKSGGNVNAQGKRRVTPLITAAQCHDLNMMSLLARNGANVNAKAADGIDAMITAVMEGQLDEVEFLLNHGFVLKDSKTTTGYTPSDVARKAGNEKILKLLEKKDIPESRKEAATQ